MKLSMDRKIAVRRKEIHSLLPYYLCQEITDPHIAYHIFL